MATQRIASDSNEDFTIDIPGAEEMLQEAADHGLPANPRQLARSIFWVATWTLVAILNRVIYKLPPPGPIFEGNGTAYYLTLFVIFLAGVAEVYAAILLSSGGRGGRACTWATPLLCASIVLLAAVIALGGSPVVIMG